MAVITKEQLEELKERYGALAEAMGVQVNSESVEPFMRRLIEEVMRASIKAADVTIEGMRGKVTSINNALEKAKKEAQEVRDITSEASKSRAKKKIIAEFEAECEKVSQAYISKMNPFHDSVEGFLEQMSRYKVPTETWSEPLAALITSIGYLQWQANKGSKEDKPPKWRRSANSYRTWEDDDEPPAR